METQKQVIKVTKQQLIEKLMTIEKSTFVGVTMETNVRMNKKNNPFHDKIVKRTKRNFHLGNDYENRVNNNEKKEGLEGSFVTEESKVGVHVSKCVLYNEKKDTYYVQLEPFKEIKPNEVVYTMDGEIIDEILFKDFLVKVSESKKQTQDRKVFIQCPKIDSIKKMNFEGVSYVVTD